MSRVLSCLIRNGQAERAKKERRSECGAQWAYRTLPRDREFSASFLNREPARTGETGSRSDRNRRRYTISTVLSSFASARPAFGCAGRSWTCAAGVRSIIRLSSSGRL